MASSHARRSATLRRRCARFLFAPLLLASFSLAPVPLVSGQESDSDLQREVDALLGWITPETPGCAVAVSRGGELILHAAYGSADLANGVPVTTDTVFDIGSVVKQFVAAAVLILVDDGRCSLGDDVRESIPELPDPGDVVTIDHLLTHTSGVRDWTGLRRMSSEDEDALTMILRQRGLDFAPGDEWAYSNSGYVLLKELVARISGQPFAEFARDRIFAPLGMEATTYTLDPSGHEKLAVSYEKRGSQWREDVLVGNERGGGGALLSTVGDLILWSEALRTGRLGEFVSAKLAEPARLSNGRELGYARGLFLEDEPGRRVFWHTGSAGGAKALLNRFPDHELSIAVLSNAGDSAPRMELVQLVSSAFLPAAGADADATLAAAPGVDVTSRAGLFVSEASGAPLELVVQRGELHVLGGSRLVPVAEDRFRNERPMLSFMSQDEFEVRFLSNDRFELETMEGDTTTYRRGEPGSPSPDELAAFAGRFESDELMSALEVGGAGDHLTLRLPGSPPLRFAPVDRDAFQFRRFFVRFLRDDGGDVVALELTNPVMRRVVFTRAGEAAGGR